jgi:hypothetical protein
VIDDGPEPTEQPAYNQSISELFCTITFAVAYHSITISSVGGWEPVTSSLLNLPRIGLKRAWRKAATYVAGWDKIVNFIFD